MNYLRLFSDKSSHDAVYDSDRYIEPWVAYINDDDKVVSYNKEQYVWVTPNTIDPTIHDMRVYGVRINGTLTEEDDQGSFYSIDFPFEDIKCKNLPPQEVNPNETTYWPFLLSTGTWGDKPLEDYHQTSLFLCIDNSSTDTVYDRQFGINSLEGNLVYSDENDPSKSIVYLLPEEDFGLQFTMSAPIPVQTWYIPWLGIKTKLL